MKRFKSLLSLVIAVVAVFMVGFTTVSAAEPADQISVDIKESWYNYGSWYANVKKAKDLGGIERYAFCLESGEIISTIPGNKFKGITLNLNRNWNNAKADAIITKAMQPGVKENSGLSDVEFYGVVQSAIWKAVNGEDENTGYSSIFQKWIGDKAERRALFEELWNTPNISYSVKFTGDTTMKKEVMADGTFLVSGNLKVEATNVPSNAKFTVSLSNINGGKNGSAGIDKNNSGKWDSTQTVSNGETVQVRMPIINGNKDYSVQLNVESSFDAGYVLYFYPDSNGQDMGVAVPVSSTINNSVKVEGTYVPEGPKTKDIDVSKTDATGQNELPGAHMEIYDLDGNLFTDWESTTEAHKVKGLIVDKIYFIRETVAPEGYDKLTTEIYFIVNSDGKAVVCNLEDAKNKGICTKASESEILAIKNYPSKTTTTKVVITKLDVTNGDEIPGAHLQILDENGKVIIEWTSTEEPYIIEGLEPGVYYLVETLPADKYNVEMIIGKERTSKYKFEIVEGETTKIDVYNELISAPNTGINVSASYIIGGLVMLIGAGTVVVAKKKEIM